MQNVVWFGLGVGHLGLRFGVAEVSDTYTGARPRLKVIQHVRGQPPKRKSPLPASVMSCVQHLV